MMRRYFEQLGKYLKIKRELFHYNCHAIGYAASRDIIITLRVSRARIAMLLLIVHTPSLLLAFDS